MEMIPVYSSNLSSVGYEDGTLYVSFHSGRTYAYSGVSVDVFRNLLSATSKGKYHAAYIKNRYPFYQVF